MLLQLYKKEEVIKQSHKNLYVDFIALGKSSFLLFVFKKKRKSIYCPIKKFNSHSLVVLKLNDFVNIILYCLFLIWGYLTLLTIQEQKSLSLDILCMYFINDLEFSSLWNIYWLISILLGVGGEVFLCRNRIRWKEEKLLSNRVSR